MDQPCSYADLEACLQGIARVNRLTLAYRPTLSWLNELAAQLPNRTGPLQIVDVGCGYGDSLRRIHTWAARKRIAVSLTGIDLNGDAIRVATAVTQTSLGIRFIHGDAFSYAPPTGIDVVLSSLLTHHLAEPEIVHFLQWMEASARQGWFVNDLHRTAFPYRAFSLLIKVLPFHRFIKNDGLVSIRRSFLHQDWQRMCASAALPLHQVSIRECRPARLCVGHIKA